MYIYLFVYSFIYIIYLFISIYSSLGSKFFPRTDVNNDRFRCLFHASLTIQAAAGGRSYMGHHWQGHGIRIVRSLAPPKRSFRKGLFGVLGNSW